jgi:hypothetical protein
MDYATTFLANHLNLGPQAVGLIISCFNDYVCNFLWNNPGVLDPDVRQIMARVRLTMAHRPAQWLWTQNSPESQRAMGQDEHATVFVLRVLSFLVAEGLCPRECEIDHAVLHIHQRLCILQSLWLENGVWVESPELQVQLRTALKTAMDNELVQKFQSMSVGA